ncbi:LamG-like jellyroll fold domain-containing protein [Sorangium sp. So ce367]|uniref:LamG-like jellyroll fold domain-containing protein n=1 Tax=Sorangium sp. So ce367 TaxID=3133305 RepID=UPI003F6199FF
MTIPAPKHYWNFDKTSGTVAAEPYSGARIALDRASWVPGRLGQAIRFNPKNGARLATTNVREAPPPWTIAAWVMREEDSEVATLFSSNKHIIRLEQWPNQRQVGLTQAGAFDATFGQSAPLHQWVHLTVVATATETTLYVNGKRQGSVAAPANLGLRWLGSSGGWTEYASVIIDDLAIFDQALTDAQVDELANQNLKLPPPSTIIPLEGAWRCTWNGTKQWTFGIKVSGHTLTIDYSDYWPGKILSGAILSPERICSLNPSSPADYGGLSADPDTIHWTSHDGTPTMVWTRA